MPKSETTLFELDVVHRPRVHSGQIANAAKLIMDQILTEEELLNNFEKYRKIVQELESIYRSVSIEHKLSDSAEPVYVSEAIFSYDAHASH